MSEKSILDYETVDLDDGDNSVVIIDQTRLPGRTEIIRLHTAKEIWDAIYLLKVRGFRYLRAGKGHCKRGRQRHGI